jgi:hypothetical protein
MPSDELFKSVPEMNDENRRPKFLMISAVKETNSINEGIK